jgi:hypothetical protein
MPPLNQKAGTVNKQKTGDYHAKKRDLVANVLQLTRRPDHPHEEIPGWANKQKHGIPELSKMVFHDDIERLDRKREISGQI